MAQHQANNSATQQDPSESDVAGDEGIGDYQIGYCNPPVEHRFPPGKSGNPRGRPKGRLNVKTELARIVSKRFTVRDGKRQHQLTLVGANVLAHGVKGAKGDVRSAGLFLNNAHKLGLLGQEDVTASDDAKAGDRQDRALIVPENKAGPSDRLFDNVDLDLLSRDEGIELSRLAAIIDLGGDITALSTNDFERIKHIVNKGRGKNVTPQ
jgi:hypothetical protein